MAHLRSNVLERSQDVTHSGLHAGSIVFALVVVTEEVQRPVNNQRVQLALEAVAEPAGVLARHGRADHDIPQELDVVVILVVIVVVGHREREDVRGVVVAGKPSIELAHVLGGDEEKRQLDLALDGFGIEGGPRQRDDSFLVDLDVLFVG
jgi:hypothetical protein